MEHEYTNEIRKLGADALHIENAFSTILRKFETVRQLPVMRTTVILAETDKLIAEWKTHQKVRLIVINLASASSR